MTTTTPSAITLRSLLPKGSDHAGTLALLAAHGLTTVEDVEDAAASWRVSLRTAMLAAGLPWTRCEEIAGKIEGMKREGVFNE